MNVLKKFNLNNEQSGIREAAASVEKAEWNLKVERDRLERAIAISLCPHENVDDSGVFGSMCRDCGTFFNTGF